MSDSQLSPDSTPKIQQRVEGNDNHVIGQAIDSIIVNFAGKGQIIYLTVHERIPTDSIPPSENTAQPLTRRQYRQREVLLSKVKQFWIQGLLEDSLHSNAVIKLGLQERLDLVKHPFENTAEFPKTAGQIFEEDVITVFDDIGAGCTLLILGEPGSGKTISLLKLAEDLISRTEKDLNQKVPVSKRLNEMTQDVIASLTGRASILEALSVAGI